MTKKEVISLYNQIHYYANKDHWLIKKKEYQIINRPKILNLIGCTPKFLKLYLESKFRSGMNWENYGQFGWHIDHIIPCSFFDLINPEEQVVCFHYSNLQPLWAKENLRKVKFRRVI